jgi:hypothetical protein
MSVKAATTPTLLAGAARQDITPPLEVGLLMSSVDGRWAPFKDVRRPLHARAIVLQDSSHDSRTAGRPIALVSLDLLTLSGKALGGFHEFKLRISSASGDCVLPENIILACTHTHTAPESGAITDLFRTDAFVRWIDMLIEQIGRAIGDAAASMKRCHVSYGASMAPGLGIHRRFKTANGIMMSHPEPPEEIVISRDGAVDDSVNVLSFRDEANRLMAVLVNATCHPVYEMCAPRVSPDYPGELTAAIEEEHPGSIALFFNGAAGNINPKHVSAGPDAAREHAARLMLSVEDALNESRSMPSPTLAIRRQAFSLPSRLPNGRDVGVQISAKVTGVRIGRAALMFLPGEPFVETGLALKQASPLEFTGVVGFSEETVGYVPTEEAFEEGGYEVGFGSWSLLSPGCEKILRCHAAQLLSELAAGADGANAKSAAPVPHGFPTTSQVARDGAALFPATASETKK